MLLSKKDKEQFISDYATKSVPELIEIWGIDQRKIKSLAKQYGLKEDKRKFNNLKKLTEHQIRYIVENEGVKQIELSYELDIYRSTLNKKISELKEKGII